MPVDVAAPVLDTRRLSADYSVLSLEAPEIARAVQPGQFVMLKQSPGFEPLLRRPFSVFEILRDRTAQPIGISILNKRVGTATRQIYDAERGQRVACLGPLGRPFSIVGPGQQAWMVAGGVGLAPFATLAEAVRQRGVETTLFYGGRSASDLFYIDLFERLGARVVLATEDGTLGTPGRITVPLERELARVNEASAVSLFACGPEPMLAAVARLAARFGRRCEVSVERVMGCGLGGCYSCVVPVKTGSGKPHFVRSCIGGPVFDAASIVWD
jgi:dihydroorotate dehydrogenase electron transfer subunit